MTVTMGKVSLLCAIVHIPLYQCAVQCHTCVLLLQCHTRYFTDALLLLNLSL